MSGQMIPCFDTKLCKVRNHRPDSSPLCRQPKRSIAGNTSEDSNRLTAPPVPSGSSSEATVVGSGDNAVMKQLLQSRIGIEDSDLKGHFRFEGKDIPGSVNPGGLAVQLSEGEFDVYKLEDYDNEEIDFLSSIDYQLRYFNLNGVPSFEEPIFHRIGGPVPDDR